MSWNPPGDAEWILFLVKSKICKWCETLMPQWKGISTHLTNTFGRRLCIEEIELLTKSVADSFPNDRYAGELARYVIWFPCIILVQRVAYEACRRKLSPALPCAVFNGIVDYTPGAAVPIDKVKAVDRLNINGPSIAEWIDKSIARLGNAPITITPSPPSPTPSPAPPVAMDETCSTMRIYPRDLGRSIRWHR